MSRDHKADDPLPTVSTWLSRFPVILPAAGSSRRMGRPKLILPWRGTTVLARVVEEFARGGAGPIVVVTPPRQHEGLELLVRSVEVLNLAVHVQWVVPEEPTPEMKASILMGLDALHPLSSSTPAPPAFLLAPADSVGVRADLVRRVIRSFDPAQPQRIIVPTRRSDARQGHPVLIPWPLVEAIRALPDEAGVNALLKDEALRRRLGIAEFPVEPLLMEDGEFLHDLDTPEDYQRLLARDPSAEQA